MTARALSVSLALLLAACEPLPDPLPRVVSAAPEGVVAAGEVRAGFTASEPLSPAGLLDGSRLALCRAEDVAAVKRLAAADAGFGPGAPVLAAQVALEDGGRRAVLLPAAPLAPGRYAAVLAPGVHAADGRPLLDAEGRQRAVVHEFEGAGTAGALAEPARLVLTEALADAETPEAGGEFVEVVNAGRGPADLAGLRLAKRSASGAFTRCTIAPLAGGPVAPGEAAIVAGGAWDGRYPLPAGTPVYQCGASALAGGLANDRAPALALEDPAGGVLSSVGLLEPAPRCAEGSLARASLDAPDAASSFACTGTVTPGAFP